MPATDPRRIAKALTSGADEVVIDLEDAVAPADKAAARDNLVAHDWTGIPSGVRVAVRVNGVGTPWCRRDLEAVVSAGVPVDSVVLPKVESRADLGFVERLLTGLEAESGVVGRLGVQALVETAAGLVALDATVSERDRLEAVILGYADLAASLGRRPGLPRQTWLAAQDRVLTCARTAGIEAVDGPFLGVNDDDEFGEAVAYAAGLGFDAKWAIHPRQVERINLGFAPDEGAVEQARRVVTALDAAHADGRGALQLDGMLIDEAMAVAARRVLAKAGA